MAPDQMTPHSMADQLAKEPSVSFRIALEKQEETWQLHTLLLDVFPPQPGEEAPTFSYAYDRAVFLTGIIPGKVAATWLTTLTEKRAGKPS